MMSQRARTLPTRRPPRAILNALVDGVALSGSRQDAQRVEP
jgi:hypothetical protein